MLARWRFAFVVERITSADFLEGRDLLSLVNMLGGAPFIFPLSHDISKELEARQAQSASLFPEPN